MLPLVLLLALPPAVHAARLPVATTPASRLDSAELEHQELIRIGRDWGKDGYSVVLDGWIPRADPTRIADVRLWWLKTHRSDERGPFSDDSARHFDVRTRRLAGDRWDVEVRSDGKAFTFHVEADGRGHLAAFATVKTAGGTVDHCRTTRGTLRARTLLGAPIGIDRLEVVCTDGTGKLHRGRIRHRKI